MVAVLGLASALLYGGSDFLGGIAARRISSLVVSLLGTVVATVVTAIAVAVTAPAWSISAVLVGGLAGLLGSIGMWAFFACLAVGPMSVLSPGVAMIYAVVPAAAGLLLGERLPPIGLVAIGAVVVSAVLLSAPGRTADDGTAPSRLTPRAIGLGVIAGLGFAGYIIAIDQTPAESGLVPLLADLVVGLLLYSAVLGVSRMRRRGMRTARLDRRAVVQSLTSGALLVAGNILLVTGLHLGDLAVMGVLNSLYPLGTVLLALAVLRERLHPLQAVGVVLALAASVALALV